QAEEDWAEEPKEDLQGVAAPGQRLRLCGVQQGGGTLDTVFECLDPSWAGPGCAGLLVRHGWPDGSGVSDGLVQDVLGGCEAEPGEADRGSGEQRKQCHQ